MAASAPTKNEEIREVVLNAARVQLAAVSAAIKFWSGWADSADKYTRGLRDELERIHEGNRSSKDTVGRLTDLSRELLRNMTELPNVAVKQFTSEIETVGKPSAKRARAARAKD